MTPSMRSHMATVLRRGSSDTPLTTRQLDALLFIQSYTAREGVPPSSREVSRALGASSPNAANVYLTALELKGYVRRALGRGRALQVVRPVVAVCEVRDGRAVPTGEYLILGEV